MQGFNMGRYIPPDLLDRGITSVNTASAKRPPGAPRRKQDGSISQTVRFECPFAIWCTTCTPETIIAQGVRFNADKKRVGSYYSTPIWEFQIKHTLCSGMIVLRTDPKNAEYLVISGGRRRDLGTSAKGEWVGEDDVVQLSLAGGLGRGGGSEVETAAREGAFGQLERGVKDKQEADTQKARLEELKRRSERDWADPYAMNKRLRSEFRVGRRQRQQDSKTGEALQERFGLGVDVVPANAEDDERAKLVDFQNRHKQNESVHSRGIFEKTAPAQDPQKERGKRGRKEVNVVGHKGALQSSVRGSTRAKNDPFLQQSEPWQPPFQTRKEKAQAKPSADAKTTTTTAALVAYDSD